MVLRELQQGGELRVLLGGQVERPRKPRHGVVGERQLAHGADANLLLVADGLAGARHHGADAIDLVAEELQARGRHGLSGPDIHRVAVHMEETGGVGGVGAGIAHAHERCRHLGKVRLLAHGKRGGAPVRALARRHAAEQRTRGSNHHASVSARQALERRATGGHHGVVGRFIAPRQVGAQGKPRHAVGAQIRRERAQRAVGGILARDHVHRRARLTSELRGHDERARRLRDRQGGVLALGKRGLDGLRALRGVELRGNAMDEHVRTSLSGAYFNSRSAPYGTSARVAIIGLLRLFYL